MLFKYHAVLFALALYQAYDVPPQYGYQVFEEAVRQDINPFDLGALLMAENKSRRYDPTTVGRYNGGGELGLYQLQPYPWSRLCGVKPAELKVARINIACAAQVVRYMQERAGVNLKQRFWEDGIALGSYKTLHKGMRRKTRDGLDWQTHYRCAPKARASQACGYSVLRVHRMHQQLLKTYFAHDTGLFWLAVVLRGPSMLGVYMRAEEAALRGTGEESAEGDAAAQ